jgi:hypothetical protein
MPSPRATQAAMMLPRLMSNSLARLDGYRPSPPRKNNADSVTFPLAMCSGIRYI